MKMTRGKGVVRKMDALHRLVIPQEYCTILKWDSGTPIEMTWMGNTLVLSCEQKSCTICGTHKGLKTVNGVSICRGCIESLYFLLNTAAEKEKPIEG